MRLFRTLMTLILVTLVVPSVPTAMRAKLHASAAITASAPVGESAVLDSSPAASEQAPLPQVPGGTATGAACDDDDRDPTAPERAGADEASILEVWSLDAPSFRWLTLSSESGDAPAPRELSPAQRPPRA